jgi:hypothetical protein
MRAITALILGVTLFVTLQQSALADKPRDNRKLHKRPSSSYPAHIRGQLASMPSSARKAALARLDLLGALDQDKPQRIQVGINWVVRAYNMQPLPPQSLSPSLSSSLCIYVYILLTLLCKMLTLQLDSEGHVLVVDDAVPESVTGKTELLEVEQRQSGRSSRGVFSGTDPSSYTAAGKPQPVDSRSHYYFVHALFPFYYCCI